MGNYTVPIPTISERATIFHIFTRTKLLQNVAETLPLFYRWRTEVWRSGLLKGTGEDSTQKGGKHRTANILVWTLSQVGYKN